MQRAPFVYILASRRNGTLYVGVTSNLPGRIWQHRNGRIAGFTRRYGVRMLVYFEGHLSMREAVVRERQIKEWRRAWKIALIEKVNPLWLDLYDRIVG